MLNNTCFVKCDNNRCFCIVFGTLPIEVSAETEYEYSTGTLTMMKKAGGKGLKAVEEGFAGKTDKLVYVNDKDNCLVIFPLLKSTQ